MYVYELAALGAAACWSVGGMISSMPVERLGTIGFNRVRMLILTVLMGGWVTITGGWQVFDSSVTTQILLSGLVGILLGDTALFGTLNRLGPRRTMILFPTHAPMTTLLSWFILDDSLPAAALTGILVTILGVVLAIAFGKRKDQLHKWEHIKGSLPVGIGIGLLAALGQSSGTLILKPVLSEGLDPFAVASLRIAVTAFGLTLFSFLPVRAFKLNEPLTMPVFTRVALSGIVGMGLGMTLFVLALEGSNPGVTATLSATSPVLMLPIMWLKTRERPALGAWIGAIVVVIGTSLILTA